MDEEKRTLGTLLTEVHAVISNEQERDAAENGACTASPYESYSLLQEALERKEAAAKELKDCMKELWTAVKDKNDGAITAYLGEIERVARESAMAWIRVAALARKAGDSL